MPVEDFSWRKVRWLPAAAAKLKIFKNSQFLDVAVKEEKLK